MLKKLLKQNRGPKIDLPWTTQEKWYLVLAVLPLLFGLEEFYSNWDILPDKMPIHFDGGGKADGWANKSSFKVIGLISLVPSILVITLSHFIHVNNMPTAQFNQVNTPLIYRATRRFMLLLGGLINLMYALIGHYMILIATSKVKLLPGMVIYVPLGFIFLAIILFMIQINRLNSVS